MNTNILAFLLVVITSSGVCSAQDAKQTKRLIQFYELNIEQLKKENEQLKKETGLLKRKIDSLEKRLANSAPTKKSGRNGGKGSKPKSVEVHGLGTIVVESCKLSGTTLVCKLKVYPTKSTAVRLRPGKKDQSSQAIDDEGNAYPSAEITLGTSSGTEYFAPADYTVTKDINVAASITLKDVSTKAKKLSLLSIKGTLNEDTRNRKQFQANFRNIPITVE